MRRDSRDTHSIQAELLIALKDTSREFSRDELTVIINEQFFDDAKPLNVDLVDAAVTRMLLLERTMLNDVSLQRERKQMICGVLRKILIADK